MRAPRKATGEPSWYWRRAVLFAVCGYCMVMLWRLVGAADTEVHEALVSGLILLLGALVLGYQGFATAQDVAAIFATRSGTPYLPPPTYPPPYGDPPFDTGDEEQRPPGAGIR